MNESQANPIGRSYRLQPLKAFSMAMAGLFWLCALPWPVWGIETSHFGHPAMTPVWADYMGTFRIDGMDAQPGDEIAIFDPQGVLCGQYTVEQSGSYGIVRVYGDDPGTETADEGATAGDLLTVKIWDSRRMLEIAGPDLALKPGLPPSGSSFLPAASPPVWQDQQGYALDVDTFTHFGSPVATPYVSNYLGFLTIAGAPAQTGDEVAVFDANGVLCGHTRISTPGQYGILQIYGDDPATASIVEGPAEGGLLTFKVWSKTNSQEYSASKLTLTSGAALGSFLPSAVPPVWQADPGSALDLAASSAELPPPVALDSLAETLQDQPVSGTLLRENPGGGPLIFLLGPSLWYFYVQDALSPSATEGLNLTPAVMANAAYAGHKGTLTLTDPTTGAFLYTPNPGATGEDYFVFRIESVGRLSNYATLRIAIAPISGGAAPLAVASSSGYAPLAAPLSVASLTEEIAALDKAMKDLRDGSITPLEAEMADLTASMTEARTFMNTFAERNAWLLTEYSVHKRRLRLYEGQALQLSMSYVDFFNAKNAWAASSDPEVRRAQVLIMFRYLYGYAREPGQWELDPNTQKDFVDMADLIVRKKAVARIGEALVLLGDLTTELIGAITGIPSTLKEAAFATIEFFAKSTCKLLPDSTVKALNETCLQYIPYLEFQKARAEQLANDLNKIRDTEEYGGEKGRVEALEKTRALVAYEQDVLANLEPEVNAYKALKTQVEAAFAVMQTELNDKIAARDEMRKTLRQYAQDKVNKEFERDKLIEMEAVSAAGGYTKYVKTLGLSFSSTSIAMDPLSSALLNLPLSTRLWANASYVTTSRGECVYTEGEGEDKIEKKEVYHSKIEYSTVLAQPPWKAVNPTGSIVIADGVATGTAPGAVPLEVALSPSYAGDIYNSDGRHCSVDYTPVGGSGLTRSATLQVQKVEEALFLPHLFHYYEYVTQKKTGAALFAAMKAASTTYGQAIDLFLGGKVESMGPAPVVHFIYPQEEGTGYGSISGVQIQPEGDLQAFEINNAMKVLGKGRAVLRAVLFEQSGVQLPLDAVNPIAVTGNLVEPTLSANGKTGLTPSDDALVVIGQPAQWAISVQGPADMSHYEVKWRYFIYQSSGYPIGWLAFDRHDGAAVTSFSGGSGQSVSLNPVTLSDPADFNRKLKVEFDVVRKYDGVIVYSGVFDSVRTIVKGKGFFLAKRTSGEAFPGDNHFGFRGLSSYSPNILATQLELRLDLGNGQSAAVPLTDLVKGLLYGTDSVKSQNLGSLTLYDAYMYLYVSTISSCGAIALGLCELKEADRESLLSTLGVAVERTDPTLMTSMDINLLRVNYRETASGPRYVFKGCAPTSLDHFKVRWTYFDDTTTETGFSRAGLYQESLAPMTKSLKKVELVNPLGNTAVWAGFLSASPGTSVNKVSREIGMLYLVATEYRYNETLGRYAGQLTSLEKHDLSRAFVQLELAFSFPENAPRVLVKTVNDVDGVALPFTKNTAITAQNVAFDVLIPTAGAAGGRLFLLTPPAFGTVAMDGVHVVYTPQAGLKQTDRFVLRMDTVCDISPDVTYYNLEVELDYSGNRPVVRFRQAFTPVSQFGGYDLGFVLMNEEGQALGATVATAPEKLEVAATTEGVNIRLGALFTNQRDLFSLALTQGGGALGTATVNVWHYGAYPEFFAYSNRDFPLPAPLLLHRLLPSYEQGVPFVKDIWADTASGQLLLNGSPLGYTNSVAASDIKSVVFRPKAGYTGPTILFFYGSTDGENKEGNQMRMGGMVLSESRRAGLGEAVRLLQILSGSGLALSETGLFVDVNGDGGFGLPEVLFILQQLAGLRY